MKTYRRNFHPFAESWFRGDVSRAPFKHRVKKLTFEWTLKSIVASRFYPEGGSERGGGDWRPRNFCPVRFSRARDEGMFLTFRGCLSFYLTLSLLRIVHTMNDYCYCYCIFLLYIVFIICFSRDSSIIIFLSKGRIY